MIGLTCCCWVGARWAEHFGPTTQFEKRLRSQQVKPERPRQNLAQPCRLTRPTGAEQEKRPFRQLEPACIHHQQFYGKSAGGLYRSLDRLGSPGASLALRPRLCLAVTTPPENGQSHHGAIDINQEFETGGAN